MRGTIVNNNIDMLTVQMIINIVPILQLMFAMGASDGKGGDACPRCCGNGNDCGIGGRLRTPYNVKDSAAIAMQ